jgi:hypothetical protein
MDMRKYDTGFIKPDQVRDGPRRERIVNIYESETYGRPVLEFESGDQFSLNATNNRTLIKAWGHDSELWLQQELELSLGTYKDWQSEEEKETVVVRAISPRKPSPDNGGTKAVVPRSKELDDEIPY